MSRLYSCLRNNTHLFAAFVLLVGCFAQSPAYSQQQLQTIEIEAEPGGDAEPTDATSGGRSPEDGRLTTTAKETTNPVDPTSILPKDFQNYSGAGNRVAQEQLNEQRVLHVHEALARVPGVISVQDDGLARHGGVGIRGSNFRRSRNVLHLEDGTPVNFSTYIDPSTHYTPPLERTENLEIIRGGVAPYGPLSNHGIINYQNLNPFGVSETVLKFVLSHYEDTLDEWGNSRHVHTRLNKGNIGVVASYSGADASGAWDNERLRYNDFYGAIGVRNSKHDLILSGGYHRQRDDYDEDNFAGTRAEFFANGRRKPFPPEETRFNTYNGDHWRIQLAHTYQIDPDTTLVSRAYVVDNQRYRFSNRDGALDEPGAHMRGRNRNYNTYGVQSKIEFANLPLVNGVKHDVQAGVKYERQNFRNCTSFGNENQRLSIDGPEGDCRADEDAGDPDTGELNKFEADAFAAFIQSSIHLTDNFTLTPGVRFEHYEIDAAKLFPFDEAVTGTSEHDHVLPSIGMAWEFRPSWTLFGSYNRGFTPHIIRQTDVQPLPLPEELGDNFQIGVRSAAIPGLTFDVAYYHSVIDNYQVKQPFTDEDGNNIFGNLDEVEFNGVEIGVRAESRPRTGGPWNFFGEAVYTFTNSNINKGTSSILATGEESDFVVPDELEIADVSGNRVPFAVENYAALTVGLAYKKIFDISATVTYRGDFFSDSLNTRDPYCEAEAEVGGDEAEGIDLGCDGVVVLAEDAGAIGNEGDTVNVDVDEALGGQVPDVWLLAARANYRPTDNLTLFIAGHNLTDELYIADVADGFKPGQGRTIRGGFTLKLN